MYMYMLYIHMDLYLQHFSAVSKIEYIPYHVMHGTISLGIYPEG